MRRTISRFLVLFLAVVVLAGLASLGKPGFPSATATWLKGSVTPGVTAIAKASPVVNAANSASATSTPTDAIKSVIDRANQEQQDALAQGDPTLMKDTATAAYYNELVQTNQDLVNHGVTAIKLVSLQWGPITVRSATSAQATTYETWQTTYGDGTTDQSRDRNVYTLVQEGGAWKIQTDGHPDANSGVSPSPAPSNPSSPVGPGATVPPISRGSGSSDVSQNWSGYSAVGGTYTGVTGTWIVPQSQGTTASSYGSRGFRNVATGATWVGIGGVQNRDLIQAGTEEISLGSGQVRYGAWIELLPRASQTIPLAVSPGDSITVSIDRKTGDQWLIAFKDNTTGQTYQRTVTYASSLSSAEWVEEAPSNGRSVLPLDNFGTIKFSGGSAIVDGKTESLSAAGATPITMVDRYGNPIATPSALNSSGDGFTVTRTNASSSTSSASPSNDFSGGFGGFPGFPGRSSRVPWWLNGD